MRLVGPAGALLLILLLGCDSTTAPNPSGDWGGPGANLTLGPSGGSIEMDCANGALDSWTIGSDGRFAASGDLAFEGGPVGGQGFPRHPASYTGTVNRSSFVLMIHLTDLDQDLGPFSLRRDHTVLLIKCL